MVIYSPEVDLLALNWVRQKQEPQKFVTQNYPYLP